MFKTLKSLAVIAILTLPTVVIDAADHPKRRADHGRRSWLSGFVVLRQQDDPDSGTRQVGQ